MFNIRDVIVTDVDQALSLVDFVASEYFISDPFMELWRTKRRYVGKFSLSFSFEISMTSLDSLFDLMVAVLLQISWMKLFSIAQKLNVLFFSGSILHLKYVGYV